MSAAGTLSGVPGEARSPRRQPHLFFLFLDGVGIAPPGAAGNPFDVFPMLRTERILGEGIFRTGEGARSASGVSVRTIDATLGVDGLPQSGTGQAAILTGENAPALLGRHFGPYPHSTLRPLLEEQNLFRELSRRGRSCAYLNAFPRQYFAYLQRHPNLTGAFPTSWRMAGNRLNDDSALADGTALSADCTSEGWKRMGYPDLPVITPEDASDVAMKVLGKTEFVLYEYYYTDHAGHGRPGARAEVILPMLDRFISALAEKIVAAGHTLLITSDHGNLEDLSRKTHTLNPVPFITAGEGCRELAEGVTDLTGIRGAVLKHFERRSLHRR
jgi:2,3-bisphosphoglycerate-independent phosphoglycerate mutase